MALTKLWVRFLVIASCIGLSAMAWADKQAVLKSQGYFDPHNHDTGILPYYAYADLDAFIKGVGREDAVTEAKRADLLAHLIAFHILGYPNTSQADLSGRASAASMATLECAIKHLGIKATELKAIKDLKKLSEEVRKAIKPAEAKLVNTTLERLLASSPWTAFDSAHFYRGEPVESFLREKHPKDMGSALAHASILQLALTSIQYVELFKNFAGPKEKMGKRIEDMKLWNDILSRVREKRSEKDSEWTIALRDFFHNFQKAVPEIAWVLMLHTSDLARDGEGTSTYSNEKGTCARADSGALRTKIEDLKPVLKENDFVVGVDFAAPEVTCFTSSGMDHYKDVVRAVAEAAKARHRKLVVHTHVGEGFRLVDGAKDVRTKNDEAACKVFESFLPVRMDGSSPVHYKHASDNLKLLLRTLSDFYPTVKNEIILRLGHVTHADAHDAEAIQKLGLWVDVNLTSNVSTRSWEIDAETRAVLGKAIPNRLRLDLPSGRLIPVYEGHSLKTLLMKNVKVVLGSDGGGLESALLAKDYDLALELIKHWNAKLPRDQEISTTVLKSNQEEHVRQMLAEEKSKAK
jgi:hypothetical protein